MESLDEIIEVMQKLLTFDERAYPSGWKRLWKNQYCIDGVHWQHSIGARVTLDHSVMDGISAGGIWYTCIPITYSPYEDFRYDEVKELYVAKLWYYGQSEVVTLDGWKEIKNEFRSEYPNSWEGKDVHRNNSMADLLSDGPPMFSPGEYRAIGERGR